MALWLTGAATASAQTRLVTTSTLDGVIAATVAAPQALVAPGATDARPTESPSMDRRLRLGMFATFAALQALDTVSTLQVTRVAGVREANPLMAGLVGRPTAFIAVKAASTSAVGAILHHVSRRRPKAALVALSAINVGCALVVASNYTHLTRRR